MYSYGPFDSDVLSDLSSAEAMNIVTSIPVSFSGGYGYRIQASDNAPVVKRESEKFISEHEDDVEWLFAKFGGMTSAELELARIIYVDREFYGECKRFGPKEIVEGYTKSSPTSASSKLKNHLNLCFTRN